jgi:hypothetical protein
MKTLFYTCCHGKTYLRMLQLWAGSLRPHVPEAATLLVLTDQAIDGDRIGAEIFHSRIFPHLPPYYEKPGILGYPHLADYHVVVFFDVDIITINNLAPLAEECLAHGGPLLNASRFDMNWEYNGALLTPEEHRLVEQEGIRGINAGAFALPADCVYSFITRWRAGIDNYHNRKDVEPPRAFDQPFVNAMVLRGEVPGFRFFPAGWLTDNLVHPGWHQVRAIRSGHLKLVHFPGNGGENKLLHMQNAVRMQQHLKSWRGSLPAAGPVYASRFFIGRFLRAVRRVRRFAGRMIRVRRISD